MKRIEFYFRYPKKKELTEEDKAYYQAQKLINSDFELQSEIEYEYDLITLDLYQLDDIIRYDEEHTQVNKRGLSIAHVLKIKYKDFKKLYEDMTGICIFTTINEK